MEQRISYGWFRTKARLLAVKAVAIVVLAIWMARSRTLLATVVLGLIIGGAIGNAIDALAYGAVVDFALFHVEIAGKTTIGSFSIATWPSLPGCGAIVDSLLGYLPQKRPDPGRYGPFRLAPAPSGGL
jgi:signal peptidase II